MTPNYIPMTAAEAEERTGLRAREVFRPTSESDCGFDIWPRNPSMRYQLGKRYSVLRNQLPVEGIRDAFSGNVDVFELIGFGRTWGDAVASAERRMKP